MDCAYRIRRIRPLAAVDGLRPFPLSLRRFKHPSSQGEDWVQGRTLAQLQEQFGKGIGQMLHDGTISLHDAVRRGGLVPMTLRELQEKYYTPNIAVAVDKAFAKFKAVEPAITQDIKSIATNAGAALGGLDYRLKTTASLARKVHADIVNEAISIKDALLKTNDVIRYTALLDADSFFEQYRKINSELHNRGYNIVRVKNTWYDGAPYKGINAPELPQPLGMGG